jgi:GNAT superfamily N-acetyltransferase
MSIEIVQITNKDEKFYRLVGPFISRRSIVAELGNPVWDDEGKVWFVATQEGVVVGFAAVKDSGKHKALCSAYVLPEYRGKGIYSTLLESRLKFIGDFPVKAIATPASVPALTKAGLKKIGQKGKFTVLGFNL